MPLDARSIAFAIGDVRLLVLYVLGYVSCVGMLCLLSKRLNRSISISVNSEFIKYLAIGEYAASVVVGSVCWYALATHPVLLWIPISLFLIISL